MFPEAKRLWVSILITGQEDKIGKAQGPHNVQTLTGIPCTENWI